MTSISEMNTLELQVHAGNVAYQIWARMPEPKPEYIMWYYGKREQSLSEALEKVRLMPGDVADGN
jgi:hypothetical protein